MEGKAIPTSTTLHDQLTARFSILLSQAQLTELLGRSIGGLRFSLSVPTDDSTRALKACGRRIDPAVEVARIISEPATRCATPTFSAKPKASFLKDWEC